MYVRLRYISSATGPDREETEITQGALWDSRAARVLKRQARRALIAHDPSTISVPTTRTARHTAGQLSNNIERERFRRSP